MHLRYDHLESHWNNLLGVIRWCMDRNRYDDLSTLWNQIRDFTHIYGYWADRLSLLDWLIVEVDNHRDYSMLVQLMYDRAFTLTLTGPSTRLEEAEALLQRAWTLRKFSSPMLQARVAALLASLRIKHHKHDEAHQWLDTAEECLHASDLELFDLARERTSMLFDRGENWLVMGEYTHAQDVFVEMLAEAEMSGWQRSIVHAQNWLAHTALLQKNYDSCYQYLSTGWPVASRIKEKRLMAYFERTYAYYYRETGDHVAAQKWAEDALDSFERLGMSPDTREMQTLLESLKTSEAVPE
jgi:LuxR family glucitol operon transcriptional activator